MRFLNKYIFLIAMILVLLLTPACFADATYTIKKLTLEECIAIALKEHPSAKIAFQNMKAAEAGIGIAKAAVLPSVELSASYSNTGSPQADSSLASTISHTGTTQATLKQSVIDFGKRKDTITEKKWDFEAARADINTAFNNVTLNVIQAYYEVLATKEIVIVNKETVEQFEQRLLQAQGFYDVGKKAKIEVTKAQVDLSNARLELIKAENNRQLAEAKLFNNMGLLEHEEYFIEEKRAATPDLPILSQTIKHSMDNRPEVIQAAWQRKAQEAALARARKEFFPEISGTLGYGWKNNWFPPEAPLWSAAISLTYPVYTGSLLTGQVSLAQAQFEAAKAKETNIRLAARLEVEQSYFALKEAIERKTVAALAEEQAKENFELAEGRYSVGFGSPLEYTDARLALTKAQTNHIQAVYDAQVAYAALRKASGALTKDYAAVLNEVKQ